ncbi:interleukin-7 isoform X2 [Ascaphus truei]|uniref:interleukin-7 isoform X2 n=1 Tax=Ascaphus truei TaxID=8439 RepID=UPI003F5AB218
MAFLHLRCLGSAASPEGLSKRDFSGECCQKDENINSTMYPCNNSMENVTHHNFNDGCCHFAGHIHTCSDSMELHYIFFMGCLLHQQTKAAKINKEFRCVLTQVTQYTEVALGCTHEKIIECKQNNKRRTKKKCSREICEIKETITKLRVCWNTFAKNLR